MKPLPLLLIPALICLNACAQGPSEPRATLRTLCPQPVHYGLAFQQQLADELDALSDQGAVVQAIMDYGQLRAVLRAC